MNFSALSDWIRGLTKMKKPPPEIDVNMLADMRASDDPPIVLDVREYTELAICGLPESLHIPMYEIPGRVDELPKDQLLVVLCHHGIRSREVARFLLTQGFSNVLNLAGGIHAWAIKIEPEMRRY